MIGRELLPELRNSGYKFNEASIVFVAKDKTNKLIWLEKGSNTAGLNHIVQKHREDFRKAYGIDNSEIALYLYEAISNGDLDESKPSKIKGGYDRTYKYDSKYFTFVSIGDNGFIVTSFPTLK